MHLLNAEGHYRQQLFSPVWPAQSVFTQRLQLNVPFLDQGFLRQRLLMKSQVVGDETFSTGPGLLLVRWYVLASPPSTTQARLHQGCDSRAVGVN